MEFASVIKNNWIIIVVLLLIALLLVFYIVHSGNEDSDEQLQQDSEPSEENFVPRDIQDYEDVFDAIDDAVAKL